MTDSTNPRVMADNIKELSGASGSQAAEISALQTTVEALSKYSTTEYDTGKRWINNEVIYGRVVTFENPISISYDSFTNTNVEFPGISKVIHCFGLSATGGFCGLIAYSASEKVLVQTERNGGTMSLENIVVEYIKAAPSSLTSLAPDTRSLEEPETEPEEPEPIEEKK